MIAVRRWPKVPFDVVLQPGRQTTPRNPPEPVMPTQEAGRDGDDAEPKE